VGSFVAPAAALMRLTLLTGSVDELVALQTRNAVAHSIRALKTVKVKLTCVVLIAALSLIAVRTEPLFELCACLAAYAGLIVLVALRTDSTCISLRAARLVRTVHAEAVDKDSSQLAVNTLCLLVVALLAGMAGVVGEAADVVWTGLTASMAVR